MGRLCYPTQHPGSPEYSGWYFSQKVVTVQGRYGTCFCRHGTNFIACWRDRGTILIGAANLSPVTNLVVGTGAVSRRAPQKRSESGGTICHGARNLSRCRIIIECRCACPGASTITNLSWVQEQKQKP
jgi:hypothetical protein